MRNDWPTWLTALLGSVATLAVAWVGVHPTPVYYSQSDVVLLAPLSRPNPNPLALESSSLIDTAGILQRALDQGRQKARTASPEIGLYDQGLYDDTRVRVPDTGGQWAHSYNRPVLDVQVTGSDPTEVRNRMLAIRT